MKLSERTKAATVADGVGKRWRLLLLPFGAIAELGILAACWILAICGSAHGIRLMRWATATLPRIDWYMGDDRG